MDLRELAITKSSTLSGKPIVQVNNNSQLHYLFCSDHATVWIWTTQLDRTIGPDKRVGSSEIVREHF
jgi:hypothetical protein